MCFASHGLYPIITIGQIHPFSFPTRKNQRFMGVSPISIFHGAKPRSDYWWIPRMISSMFSQWIAMYPLVMTNSLLLQMTIEIVDFPMKHGGSFHSFL